MARISTYPNDTNVTGRDKWIGSDANNDNVTKNFTSNAVASYFNKSAIIDTGQFAWSFIPYSNTQPQPEKTFMKVDWLNSSININNLSGVLRVSALTIANTTPGDFMVNEWVGKNILIHSPGAPSAYSIYTVDSLVLDPDSNWYYLMTLSFVSGESFIIQENESVVMGYFSEAVVVNEVTGTFPIIVTDSSTPNVSIDSTKVSNWDNAYDNSIISAEVTGTSTKTLTLNQEDGGTIQASWSDADTGLTSVGLSMPSAFTVANSPLTSNGTIAVTGAGVASQYVRGDGTLANFPTSGGGGSSVSYYLNGGVSQGTIGGNPYEQMSKVAVVGTNADFNINTNGYIANFVTNAGDPSLLNIPAGNWNFEMYFSSSSSGGTPRFYIELYKYDGTTLTPIANSSATPELITGGTAIDLYTTAVAVPSTSLTLADRLAIRVYVLNSGRTITLHTQDSHLCEVITTFSTGITALNGLTEQVQYFAVGTTGSDFNISSVTATHTFNLPTASAVNRGALSSADWTTFNNKQDALTNPITGLGTTNYVPKFTSASSIGDSNIQDSGSLITLGSNTFISSGSLTIGTTDITAYSVVVQKNITGALTSYGVMSNGQIQSDVTNARMFNSRPTTVDSSFTLPILSHYVAQQGTFGASSTVTNQYGFLVDSSVIGATNNYAFRGQIPFSSSNWNLYMDGTADNYLAGSLGIGSTTIAGRNVYLNKNLTGASLAVGFTSQGEVQSDVTNVRGFSTAISTAADSFNVTNLYHYAASQSTIGAGSSVTSQMGFMAISTLSGATNNYGFYGQLAAATNTWNLYMAGTANNYLAGSIGIGQTVLTGYSLRVGKNLTGATATYGVVSEGIIQSDVTSRANYFITEAKTVASTFTLSNLYHYRATQSTIGAGSTVTNQYAFFVASSLTGATNNYAYYSDIVAATNSWNLYMAGTANNYMAGSLGIGTTSLTGYNLRVSKNITGSTTSYGVAVDGTIQSDVTTSNYYYRTLANTVASTFTLGTLAHYSASQGTFGAGSTVTNQYGFLVDNSFTSATNNYGFYGNISSGTNRWNLYMQGTANNYIAGNLGIGSTSPSGKLEVNLVGGAAYFTRVAGDNGTTNPALQISTSTSSPRLYAYGLGIEFFTAAVGGTGTIKMILTSSGELGIGTSTVNASAILQTDSTTKGVLFPRMTTTQKNAISSPATGLVVFDTTLGKLCVFSTTWQTISSS